MNTNFIDFLNIKSMLTPPVKREAIIEVISHGANLPPMIKGAVFLYVQRMSDNELDKIGLAAIEAIECIEEEDFLRLEIFLIAHDVPEPISNLVKAYATSHFTKV